MFFLITNNTQTSDTNASFENAFVSDVFHRCLCIISDKTEMDNEKEYLITTSFFFC